MKMRKRLFLLFVFQIYEILSVMVSPETDCYNKGFICYDEDRFYQCVDIGNKTVTLGEPQFCPEGLKCNDEDEIECGEPWPAEIFTSTSKTTLKSQVTQSDTFEETETYTRDKIKYTTEISVLVSVTDYDSTNQFVANHYLTTNGIQSESNLITNEELENELVKLTVTTESISELPSFEDNEFVDALTTKLPVSQETLSGWNESGWEPESGNGENGSTTEMETIETDAPEDADYDYIYDFWNEDVSEEYSTTTASGTLTTKEGKATVSTSEVKPSTDVLFSTTTDYDITTVNLTTESFDSFSGNLSSNSNTTNFSFITEQNENSVMTEKTEVSLNLETQSEIETSVDYELSTSKLNTVVFHQTIYFQTQNSVSTTAENKLLEATTAGFTLTEENSMLTESVDNKEHSTETSDEITESTTSLLYYTDGFIASEKFVDSTNFKTTEEFTTSSVTHAGESNIQTTSGAIEESSSMKTEEKQQEGFTSDTTLLVESDDISETPTIEHSEEITSTQSESTSDSVRNSTGINIVEYVSTNQPTITANCVQDSKTTESESELYNFDDDSKFSTGNEIEFLTTDSYISREVEESTLTDKNQNSQSTLRTYTTNTEITETTEEDMYFRSDSTIEDTTRPATDATSQQESEIFEKSTLISNIVSYTTEENLSFASGIFTEELITTEKNTLSDTLLALTTETVAETDSIINENVATEINTEELSSTQYILTEENIYDNTDTSTTSEINVTESSRVKGNEFNENVTSETVGLSVENSVYLSSDFSTISLSISTNPQTDNTESTIHNKETVEFDENFTDEDALSITETQVIFSTTDLPLTSSNKEIHNTNNELEVTTEATPVQTNDKNNTKLSVNPSFETEKDSIFNDDEISATTSSIQTMESVSTEDEVFEESSFSKSKSTSSDVSTFGSSEMPNTFTTEFFSKEFPATVSPVSSFTCSSVGKFPDPKSCSKFYLCINAFVKFITIPLDCPKDTSFDSILNECTRRPVQCPGETPLICTTSGVYPHPTDCSRYYKCLWPSFNKNFILKQFKCPRGTRYQPGNRRCERTTAMECADSFASEIADGISFRCVEAGRFAVESSCREYYECKERNGKITSYRKSCSESKLFDAEWGRCRRWNLVVCPFSDYLDSSETDDRSAECR